MHQPIAKTSLKNDRPEFFELYRLSSEKKLKFFASPQKKIEEEVIRKKVRKLYWED